MRLTTCIRLTSNSFPKLSLKHSPPLKRRGSRSAEYTGGPVNIPAVLFPGDTGESIFQVRHEERLKKYFTVDVGFEPTTQRNHGMSTKTFVKDISGY